MSLHTDNVPGNAGMLDILLALEWVQTNIVYFGGDHKRVTVAGQSAGAAAASALLVSPLVRPGKSIPRIKTHDEYFRLSNSSACRSVPKHDRPEWLCARHLGS